MRDGEPHQQNEPPAPGDPPSRSRLGRILKEHPEARQRIGDAVASLLKVVVATLALVGILAIWHLRRRAQLIRDRLDSPRCNVSLDDFQERL